VVQRSEWRSISPRHCGEELKSELLREQYEIHNSFRLGPGQIPEDDLANDLFIFPSAILQNRILDLDVEDIENPGQIHVAHADLISWTQHLIHDYLCAAHNLQVR
jgi:GTP cyclohydrolase III